MGKTKQTEEEWAAIIREQKASGQTQREWCQKHDINIYTLRNQIRQKNKNGNQEKNGLPNREVEWAEIINEAAQPPGQAKSRPGKAAPTGRIWVGAGKYRLAADAGYPVEKLALLCRELAKPC